MQCAGTPGDSIERGSLAIERKIVAQGLYAARFFLPPDPAKRTACEVLHQRTLSLGSDDYYALDLYFPRGWREPSTTFWGLDVAQFNYELIWGAPVALAAHRRYVNLVLQSGMCNDVASSAPGCALHSGNGVAKGNLRSMYAIPSPLVRGVWHQLIVHVRWSAGSDGQIDVWHRVKGGRGWRRTVHVQGVVTVQWSSTKPATSAMPTVDKIGAYRGPSSAAATTFSDGFCVASSFRAAESCL